MDTKICTRCKEEKALVEFYFVKNRGLHQSRCKGCTKLVATDRQRKIYQSSNYNDNLTATFYKLITSVRGNGRTRKLDCELDIAFLSNLYAKQKGVCFYTGTPMHIRTKNHIPRHPLLISVDRVNSAKGYTKDNVVLCCYAVNLIKGVHSPETTHEVLSILAENIQKRNTRQVKCGK